MPIRPDSEPATPPAVIGDPNQPPPVVLDATPLDPDREPYVSPTAAYVVTAHAISGGFVRGDKVSLADLGTGADPDRLIRLHAIVAIDKAAPKATDKPPAK
jgi:hypothetical protein